MIFLTEEDVRLRCQASGEFTLYPNERLTPAAAELLRSWNCRVTLSEQSPMATPAPCQPMATSAPCQPVATPEPCQPVACATPEPCQQAICPGQTYLDAQTIVAKSHPRIALRGKLDSLIAKVVLIQTQFDPQNKLPNLVKNGLADLNLWLWQVLQAEVSGEAFIPQTLCSMDMDTIHQISQNPQQYLQQGHLVPDLALGRDVASLNWLRAEVREVEVEMVKSGIDRADLLMAINRLSSAVYVLMLLTVVAQSGRSLSIGQK